jgi:amidase
MKKILRNQVIYAMGKSINPVMSINPGETIRFETEDCFSHQLVHKTDSFDEHVDFSKVNPASGPVFIKGISPGDTLKVFIKKINLDRQGVTVAVKDLGVLGQKVKYPQVEIIPIDEESVFFAGKKIPTRPMIGVIGVAPAENEIPNSTPGDHGGNMDTLDISCGACVYLPVFVNGAYFAIGDVHATMGNGEICGTGVECRAEVDLTIDIYTKYHWRIPVIETDEYFYFIGSALTLDEAVEKATDEAVMFLERINRISWNTAYMLASLSADVIISQAVNPLKTVRIRIPKKLTG